MSLSHFCPTAAGLLFEDVPLQVVDAELPPELAGNVEAFDAVEALPPLLRPGMLTDLDGFDAWERDAVELLARADLGHVQALDRIAAATEIVRTWKPTAGPLRTCVADAFRQEGRRSAVRYELDEGARLDLVNASGLASAGCGLERPPDFEESWDRYATAAWAGLDRPVARYLAAKLVGHRIAYECRGLRSLVEWLRVVLAVLRNEAIRVVSGARDVLTGERFLEAVRAADLALVHRLDTAALARGLAAVEGQP